jgi:hypothetical protein
MEGFILKSPVLLLPSNVAKRMHVTKEVVDAHFLDVTNDVLHSR